MVHTWSPRDKDLLAEAKGGVEGDEGTQHRYSGKGKKTSLHSLVMLS